MNTADTTLLLTRPPAGAARFAAMVQARIVHEGAEAFARVEIAPLLRIDPVAAALDDGPDSAFAFTSEQGARAAAALSPPRGRRAYCVGDRTAATAAALGYDARSARGRVADLAAAILADPPSGALIHAKGVHSRGDLTGRLSAAGLSARSVSVYDQVAQPLSAAARALLDRPGAVIAPVFSPRSGVLLARALGQPRAQVAVAAISDAALAPFADAPLAARQVAPTPDAAGLCTAVIRLLSAPSIA